MRRVLLVALVFAGSTMIFISRGRSETPRAAAPATSQPSNTQTHGGVRVTLLGVSCGTTYRKCNGENADDDYGPSPTKFVSVSLFVERLGPPAGPDGKLGALRSGAIELKSADGVVVRTRNAYDAFFDVDKFPQGAVVERLPAVGKDSVNATICMHTIVGPQLNVPRTLTIDTAYDGETFHFGPIALP